MENQVTLSEEQFRLLIAGMKSIYTQATFIPDEVAYNMWYRLICDLDYETIEAAILKHMATSKFPPTPADIRAGASTIKGDVQELTELEAWHLVRKAISNSNYHADEEFEKLPPVVQKAVGHPSNLREWAMMDSSEVETVQEALFARNYTTMLKREKELRQTTPAVRTLIEQTAQTLYIPRKEEPAVIEDKREPVPMPDHIKERFEEMKRRLEHGTSDLY